MDLMSLVDAPINRDFYGVTNDSFHCLIRNEFKYTWARAGGEELLFNLKEDPMERHNLAADKGETSVLHAMRGELIRRMAAHNSPCVQDRKLKPGPTITGPQKVCKWPGFHSTVCDSDVLH